MSGVTTSSLSLAWSLRNWLILDYEEANGQTVRPWAPFLLLTFGQLLLLWPSVKCQVLLIDQQIFTWHWRSREGKELRYLMAGRRTDWSRRLRRRLLQPLDISSSSLGLNRESQVDQGIDMRLNLKKMWPSVTRVVQSGWRWAVRSGFGSSIVWSFYSFSINSWPKVME